MPMLRVNGTELYYEDTGGRGPAILFSHGLLWDTSLFAPQIAALKSRYRCVAYDHRGQGRLRRHAFGRATARPGALAPAARYFGRSRAAQERAQISPVERDRTLFRSRSRRRSDDADHVR